MSINKIRNAAKAAVQQSRDANRINPFVEFRTESDESEVYSNVNSNGEDEYIPGCEFEDTRMS